MTVLDPCATSPRQPQPDALPERTRTAVPTDRPPSWPQQRCGPMGHDEPPAGLGPWVPPLPRAEPFLPARALTWLGVSAVTLLIAAAAAIAVVIGANATPVLSASDGLYLDSVRGNSSLSSTVVSDGDLIDTGREVCQALDERPSTSSVLGTMSELGTTYGWGDDDVAAVVGSAIGAYCPRHITLIDS